MKTSSLFLFALTAAVGNALFAAGQKKASGDTSSLMFISASAIVCILLTFAVFPLLKNQSSLLEVAKTQWKWILLSGTGLFFTYLGFNLLYRHFGASGYVYYAVLSIITTSILVGAVIFRERMNIFHYSSIAAAFIAIILFSVGQHALSK